MKPHNYLCPLLVSFILYITYIFECVLPVSSLPPTCVQSILLWAPGERSEAQDAGDVNLRPLDNRRLLLRGGAGMAAAAGWKNSAGRWKRGEMPLAPPSPSLFLPLLLLLETPPWRRNTHFPFPCWCQFMHCFHFSRDYHIRLTSGWHKVIPFLVSEADRFF